MAILKVKYEIGASEIYLPQVSQKRRAASYVICRYANKMISQLFYPPADKFPYPSKISR